MWTAPTIMLLLCQLSCSAAMLAPFQRGFIIPTTNTPTAVKATPYSQNQIAVLSLRRTKPWLLSSTRITS